MAPAPSQAAAYPALILLERRLTEALAPSVSGADDVAALRARAATMRAERDALARRNDQLDQELAGSVRLCG